MAIAASSRLSSQERAVLGDAGAACSEKAVTSAAVAPDAACGDGQAVNQRAVYTPAVTSTAALECNADPMDVSETRATATDSFCAPVDGRLLQSRELQADVDHVVIEPVADLFCDTAIEQLAGVASDAGEAMLRRIEQLGSGDLSVWLDMLTGRSALVDAFGKGMDTGFAKAGADTALWNAIWTAGRNRVDDDVRRGMLSQGAWDTAAATMFAPAFVAGTVVQMASDFVGLLESLAKIPDAVTALRKHRCEIMTAVFSSVRELYLSEGAADRWEQMGEFVGQLAGQEGLKAIAARLEPTADDGLWSTWISSAWDVGYQCGTWFGPLVLDVICAFTGVGLTEVGGHLLAKLGLRLEDVIEFFRWLLKGAFKVLEDIATMVKDLLQQLWSAWRKLLLTAAKSTEDAADIERGLQALEGDADYLAWILQNMACEVRQVAAVVP